MAWSSILGVLCLIAIIAFVVFAFGQGQKVRKRSEGVPPEETGGGTFH
jgi:hypothetical protein